MVALAMRAESSPRGSGALVPSAPWRKRARWCPRTSAAVIVVKIFPAETDTLRPRPEIDDGQFADIERFAWFLSDAPGIYGDRYHMVAGGDLRRGNSAYGPIGANADASTNTEHAYSPLNFRLGRVTDAGFAPAKGSPASFGHFAAIYAAIRVTTTAVASGARRPDPRSAAHAGYPAWRCSMRSAFLK
ncbi:MAG: hypothetical protein ACREFH_11180 [Stellaceae bacterium]